MWRGIARACAVVASKARRVDNLVKRESAGAHLTKGDTKTVAEHSSLTWRRQRRRCRLKGNCGLAVC